MKSTGYQYRSYTFLSIFFVMVALVGCSGLESASQPTDYESQSREGVTMPVIEFTRLEFDSESKVIHMEVLNHCSTMVEIGYTDCHLNEKEIPVKVEQGSGNRFPFKAELAKPIKGKSHKFQFPVTFVRAFEEITLEFYIGVNGKCVIKKQLKIVGKRDLPRITCSSRSGFKQVSINIKDINGYNQYKSDELRMEISSEEPISIKGMLGEVKLHNLVGKVLESKLTLARDLQKEREGTLKAKIELKDVKTGVVVAELVLSKETIVDLVESAHSNSQSPTPTAVEKQPIPSTARQVRAHPKGLSKVVFQATTEEGMSKASGGSSRAKNKNMSASVTRSSILPNTLNLQDAIQIGNTGLVRSLLDQHGSGIGQQAKNDLLLRAFKKGHTEIISLLLKYDADAKQVDNIGRTLWHVIAEKGHTELVSLLLQHGVDAKRVDNYGRTPLYVAAEKGHTEIISLLLQHGIGANQETNDGMLPLYVAVKKGYAAIVSLLVSYGVGINKEDKQKRTLLHIAAKKGHVDVVSVLLEHGAKINTIDVFENTPLFQAVQKGRTQVVRLLLDNGAEVKQAATIERLLHVATQGSFEEIIDLLLGHVTDAITNDILNIAVKEGHAAIVSLLFQHQHGAVTNQEGVLRLLDIAVEKVHTTILPWLLQHKKLDVNQVGKDGKTLLHIATEKGKESVVSVLLENGADSNQKDAPRLLDIAVEKGYTAIVSLLFQHGAVANQEDVLRLWDIAVEKRHIDILSYLLQHKKLDANQVGKGGKTLLRIATEKGEESVVSVLLKNGANANQADEFGDCQLHVAIEKGYVEVVRVLLENGANVNQVRSWLGDTPLHIAVLNKHKEIISLLLESGAGVELIDSFFKITPLQLAAREGNTDIVELLNNSLSNNNSQVSQASATAKGHQEDHTRKRKKSDVESAEQQSLEKKRRTELDDLDAN